MHGRRATVCTALYLLVATVAVLSMRYALDRARLRTDLVAGVGSHSGGSGTAAAPRNLAAPHGALTPESRQQNEEGASAQAPRGPRDATAGASGRQSDSAPSSQQQRQGQEEGEGEEEESRRAQSQSNAALSPTQVAQLLAQQASTCTCQRNVDAVFRCMSEQSALLLRAYIVAIEGASSSAGRDVAITTDGPSADNATTARPAPAWPCGDAAYLASTCYLNATRTAANVYGALSRCAFPLANLLVCGARAAQAPGAPNRTAPSLLGGAPYILGTLFDAQRAGSVVQCVGALDGYARALANGTACYDVCSAASAADFARDPCAATTCRTLFGRTRSLDSARRGSCAATLLDAAARFALRALRPRVAGGDARGTIAYASCWSRAEQLAQCARQNVAQGGGMLGPTADCTARARALALCIGGAPLGRAVTTCMARDAPIAMRCAPMVDVDYPVWFFNTTARA